MKKILFLGISCLWLLSFSMINPAVAQQKAVNKEMKRGKVKSLDGGKIRAEENARTGY